MAAAALRPAPEESHAPLAFAVVVAVALHVGGFAALRAWQPEDMTPPGEQTVVIDLAPALTEAPTLAPAEVAQPLVTEAETISPTPTEAKPIDTPPEAVEPVEEPDGTPPPPPVDEAVPLAPETAAPAAPDSVAVIGSEASEETIAAEAAPRLGPDAAEALAATEAPVVAPTETAEVAPPDAVTAKEPPKPREPERKPVDKPKPKPAIRAASTAPSTPRIGQASSSRQDNGGSAASADPDAANRYAAQIRAAVHRRARYPAALQARGIRGVATVRVTVHRGGRVLSSSLIRSAGNEAIDRAAMAAVAPGSTLPAAPPSITQQQKTFELPLSFSVRGR